MLIDKNNIVLRYYGLISIVMDSLTSNLLILLSPLNIYLKEIHNFIYFIKKYYLQNFLHLLIMYQTIEHENYLYLYFCCVYSMIKDLNYLYVKIF